MAADNNPKAVLLSSDFLSVDEPISRRSTIADENHFPRVRFLHPFSSLEFWFPPLYPPDSLVASHHQVLLKPGQDLRKLCSGLFPTY